MTQQTCFHIQYIYCDANEILVLNALLFVLRVRVRVCMYLDHVFFFSDFIDNISISNSKTQIYVRQL